ncbi:MAG TPA: BTAD domain-containing putative transcriptional regulator [Candidatus Elarobacter sp.]|nr:BTAD domain-containing putative transcriptional regulator [Candidatus Elarobacter sp.]
MRSDRIRRRAIAQWFEKTMSAPVRVVCAPLGCGKTIAVQHYVDSRGGAAGYARVPAGASAETLHEIIAGGSEFEEIVLDDFDRADEAARAALFEEIADGAPLPRLVLAGRSRQRMNAHTLLAQGLATACDPQLLAFDAAEIAALANSMGVPHDADDAGQLLYDTDGWPLAAQWLIRDAAESDRTLHDAFTHWRQRNEHILHEYVDQEFAAEPALADAFRLVLNAEWRGAQPELERLERLGLPITRSRGGLQPFSVFARLRSTPAAVPESAPGPETMLVSAFGAFRCEIGGRPVKFLRRRDQHVFAYIATAPQGRASRDQLLAAFWHDVQHAVAAQGLRTTLSRIRRALADAAPQTDPESYFETVGEVRLNWSHASVDVRRFLDQVESARLEEARGAHEQATRHYARAHRLYGDRLLAAEAAEACFEPLAAELHAAYVEALTRLTELHAKLGQDDAARDYARVLMSLGNEEARAGAVRIFTQRHESAAATA